MKRSEPESKQKATKSYIGVEEKTAERWSVEKRFTERGKLVLFLLFCSAKSHLHMRVC